MTIKEAAAKYGVSVQAVYSRLKKNGVTLESIIIKETGQLTADGEAVLFKLYDESAKAINQKRDTLNDELNRLKALNESLTAENERLKIRLEATETALAEAKNTLDVERSLFQRFLPAAGQTGKPGLFARIKNAIRG